MSEFGDFGSTEAQIDLLASAERFARETSPIERVRFLLETPLGFDDAVWKEIAALGWLGIGIPENYGGVGLSMTEAVPVMEQLGRYMLQSPFLAATLAAQAILSGGTEAQKQSHLPALAGGQAASLALSELNGDWDLNNIETTALPENGGFRLSGKKVFVLDALAANTLIVSAKLDGKTQLFCIKRDCISDKAIRREGIIDETKRSYEIIFSNLTVPKTALMDTDKTQDTLTHIHLVSNLLSAAELTGAAQATIDYTLDYLKTRKQFGKLIGSYQALKHPMVDAYVEYEKSRSLLYAAAYSFDALQPSNSPKGEIAVRMAAVQADKALSFAADRSIQFHGGFGFTYDCDAQLYRRRAIFQTSQYGDGSYHKKKLAKLLL